MTSGEPIPDSLPPNPYVGPQPYTAADRDRFSGRNDEIAELTSLVVAQREVVVYSPSGAGKTSLLNAGVVPRLKDRGFDVLPTARVGQPLGPGTAGLTIQNIYTFSVLSAWMPDTPPRDYARMTLAGFFEGRQNAPDQSRLRIAILDQFEELFTKHPNRWKDRDDFLKQLAAALEADRRLRVIIAIREEWVGRLRRFADWFPGDLRTWFHLERLRERAAIEAVTSPAEKAGRTYAPGVAEQLVASLTPVRVKTEDGQVIDAPGEFVEPVHLQIVCERLWNAIPAAAKEIDAGHLAAHGNVAEALSAYYEAQISEVARANHTSPRRLRHWFERKLVGDDGRRTRLFEKDGEVGGLPLSIVRQLQAKYLLRADVQGDTTWFELAHDRLVEPVQLARRRYRSRVLPMQLAAAVLLVAAGFVIGRFLYDAVRLNRLNAEVRELSDKVAASPQPDTLLHDTLLRALQLYPQLGSLDAAISLKDALQLAVNAAAPGGAPSPVPPCPFTLPGNVEAATFSPDGRYAAVSARPASGLRRIVARDLNNCRVLAARPQRRHVQTLQLDANGTRLALVESPGLFGLLAPEPPSEKGGERGFQILGGAPTAPGLLAVALGAERYIATAAWDGKVTLWSASSREQIRTLPVESNRAWDVAFDQREERLITAHQDGTIIVWNIQANAPVKTWRAHDKAVRRVALSPSGDLLATAGWDNAVKVWALKDAVLRYTLTGHSRPVNSVAFSPSGDRLASAASDGTIKLWPSAGGAALATFKHHKRSVRFVSFSRDGQFIASAGADRMAYVTNVATGAVVATLKHDATVWSAAFNPDGSLLVTASEDGIARVWNARSNNIVKKLGAEDVLRAPIADARFTAGGDTIITAGSDDTCRWWDWNAQRERGRIFAHGGAAASGPIALHPDGTQLAMLDASGHVRLVEAQTQKELKRFSPESGGFSGMTFSGDGRFLATFGAGPEIQVWDIATGAVVRRLTGGDSPMTRAAFDTQAIRLVAADARGHALIWTLNGTQAPVRLAQMASDVSTIALSPGGDLVVAGGPGGFQAWNAVSGYRIVHMPDLPVVAVTVADSGKRLRLALKTKIDDMPIETVFHRDWISLMASAFVALPGDRPRRQLHQIAALALAGSVEAAIDELQQIDSPEERTLVAQMQLVERLRRGTFTPSDLQPLLAR